MRNSAHFSTFIFGLVAGFVLAIIFMGTAQSADLGVAAKPPVTLQHREDYDGGDEAEWNAAHPDTGKEPAHIHAPRGSFGFVGCGQYGIWVFLADGKSYRYDSKGKKLKTPEEMQKLLAWLDTGPTDIVKLECSAVL